MIDPILEENFFENRDKLMVKAANVAVLRDYDRLSHALLMLSNSYTTLPVLDREDRVLAKIYLGDVLNASIENHEYNLDRLADIRVRDILEQGSTRQTVRVVREDADMTEILDSLSVANFSCVVDEDNKFLGIITRKELMSRVNRVLHGIEREYLLLEKGMDLENFLSSQEISESFSIEDSFKE